MKNTAVLLLSCPDRKGIIATVSTFLYQHGANVIHADQHQDSAVNLFFMRIEWDLADFTLSLDKFSDKFIPIAQEFQMNWRGGKSNVRSKLAIFLSRAVRWLFQISIVDFGRQN